MRNLKELVKHVNRNKTKHLEAYLSQDSNKLLEFYHALSDDRFHNEKAAEEYFFGDTKNKHSNFNRLKRQLFDRMSELILLIDFSESPYDNPNKGYSYCAKNVAVINIWNFMSPSGNLHIIKLAEKTLRIALHHSFSDMIVASARFCYRYYSNKYTAKTKRDIYRKLILKYLKVLEAELLTEQYHGEFINLVIKTRKTPSEAYLNQLQVYANQVKGFSEQYSSFRLDTYSLVFLTMYYEYHLDFEQVVSVNLEAIEKSKTRKVPFTKKVLGVAHKYVLSYLIKLGRYTEARKQYDISISLFAEGSRNWFDMHDQNFLLCMHTEDYKQAQEILAATLTHPNFKKLTELSIEKWHIKEAHIHHLAKLGYIRLSPKMPPFSIKRFLRNVASSKRDAGGFGIGVLIIEILLLLLSPKGQDELLERADALKTYTRRYLRDDYTFRITCMVKMLIIMINTGFHPVRTMAHVKAKGLLKKLKSVPFAEAKQAEDIEIIPFERLWDMALESIKK